MSKRARIGRSAAQAPHSSAAGLKSASHPAADVNLFDAGVDASWEVDVFGARRASIAGARADFARERSLRRLTLVSVAAEVVLAYTDVEAHRRVSPSRATTLPTRRARRSSRNNY